MSRGIAAFTSFVAQTILLIGLVQALPCDDYSDWKTKKGKGCDWVSEKPNKRCATWGTTESDGGMRANVACKKSCQTCSCKDSETWVTKVKNELKDCDYISKKLKRCKRKGVDGIRARDACPISCNTCLPQAPTLSPTSSPTLSPRNRPTGQLCTKNSQCLSKVCRRGTCFANQSCKVIKHQKGVAFNDKKIVLVFVGSGFKSKNVWRQQVFKTYSTFSQFEMFGDSVQGFNAFYVDSLQDPFCNFGCYGIDRLLCCSTSTALSISSKCFSSRVMLQTIVIHNDEKYGGAGYSYQNIATASIHPYAGLVTVHELGHSLFELGDEYTYGWGTPNNDPNCDVAGCPKWSDLSDHTGKSLCKPSACQRGEHFAGEVSFMWSLNAPVGDVNLRFTCCTYLALTKSAPSYCDKFEFGKGLLNYCKRDYQRYGDVYEIGKASNSVDSKYITVAQEMVLLVNIEKNTFTYVNQYDESDPKPYPRRQIFGDYPSIIAAKNAGISKVMKVTVIFEGGLEQDFIFKPTLKIEVPPEDDKLITKAIVNYAPSTIEIVVDGNKGKVNKVNAELKDVSSHY